MAEEEGGKAFVWEAAFVWVFIGAGTASTIWATHSLNLLIITAGKEVSRADARMRKSFEGESG